jgi:hypothetical protein
MIFAAFLPSSLLFIVFPPGYQSRFIIALLVEDDNSREDTGDARNVNRECASSTRSFDFAGFASLTRERIWNRDCYFLLFPASSAAEVSPLSLSHTHACMYPHFANTLGNVQYWTGHGCCILLYRVSARGRYGWYLDFRVTQERDSVKFVAKYI